MNKSIIRYTVFRVLGLEGFALIVSALVGALYSETQLWYFLICGIIYLGIGFINNKNKPKDNIFFAKEGFIMVALSWLVMSICGALPMFISGEIPNFVDAFFEIVSGFTTTGSTILNDVEALSKTAMFWRLFTHWFGGMGILVFVMAILPMSGGYGIHILKAESPGPVVGKLVSKLSSTAKILYGIYASMTIIEIALLAICKLPLFDAVTLSFATAGTGGFGLLNTGFATYSSAVQIIVAIFMLLFGVNFNVYYFILIGKGKEAIKCEEVKWYFVIVFSAITLITINLLRINYYSTLFETLKHALFQVSSIITTTGFATDDFNLWPTFSKLIIVMLMFCGACAGSTGGGFKVSRVVMLAKDVKNRLLRNISPRNVRSIRYEGKPVDKETIESVRSYLCIYVLVFIVSIFIVALDKGGFDFTECFTAVAATINNIGPGLGKIGPMGNFADFSILSKLVLSFDMLAGRLELIPMLILFLPVTYKKKNK